MQMARMEGKLCASFVLFLCLVWQVQAEVNCTTTGAGRFADSTDPTCQNYTLCVLNPETNTFISYNYTCPTTSLFNPNTSQCTTEYTCNPTNTTTNSSVCTEEGFIADPTSTNCTGYILCLNVDGVFQETPDVCPDSSFYDPETTLCVAEYNCTASNFTCTSAGRFPNTDDPTCQTYYLCVLNTDNNYVEYEYTCPTTSVFNPTSRVCTTSYDCPTA